MLLAAFLLTAGPAAFADDPPSTAAPAPTQGNPNPTPPNTGNGGANGNPGTYNGGTPSSPPKCVPGQC